MHKCTWQHAMMVHSVKYNNVMKQLQCTVIFTSSSIYIYIACLSVFIYFGMSITVSCDNMILVIATNIIILLCE